MGCRLPRLGLVPSVSRSAVPQGKITGDYESPRLAITSKLGRFPEALHALHCDPRIGFREFNVVCSERRAEQAVRFCRHQLQCTRIIYIKLTSREPRMRKRHS